MQKRFFKNFIVTISLVAFFILSMGMSPAYTMNTVAASIEELQQRQQETQDKMDSVEAMKKEAEDVLKALQGEASSLQGEYSGYASRLKKITDDIDNAERSIKETEENIINLQSQLEQAQADEAETKELMKVHIQYMYENNSNQSMLVLLLSSDSMSTFLRRAEYTAAIIQNDQDLVDKYQQQQETIKNATAELEQKQIDLEKYQESLVAQVDGLKALTDEAKAAYQDKTGEVYVAQGTVDEYNAMMSELQAEMRSLQNQQAAAQMELAKQMAGSDNSNSTDGTEGGSSEGNVVDPGTTGGSGAAYGAGQDERMLLAACIQAEAWGEGRVGQLAVGSVIMNRVADSRFPGTITGVITQRSQFASYPGPINRILERGVAPECLAAADQVLGGYRSGNWLFFMTKPCADGYGITGYTMIGNHAFFYKWGAN